MHLNIHVETNKMRQFSIQSNGQNVLEKREGALNKSTYFRPRKSPFLGEGEGSLFYHKGPSVVIDPRALKDTVQPNYPIHFNSLPLWRREHIPAPTPTPSPSIKKLCEKAHHKRGGMCLWGNGMKMIYDHPIRASKSLIIILFWVLHFDRAKWWSSYNKTRKNLKGTKSDLSLIAIEGPSK